MLRARVFIAGARKVALEDFPRRRLARHRAPPVPVAPGDVLAEPALEYRLHRQAKTARQFLDRFVFRLDQLTACLGILIVLKRVANRMDAAPDPRPRLDDTDVGAPPPQFVRRGQTREAGTNDEDGWGGRRRHEASVILLHAVEGNERLA